MASGGDPDRYLASGACLATRWKGTDVVSTPILLVGALTLLASFFCSLFEAALYAITPSQLELLRKRGTRGANRLARLRADVEEPIAAILTINTVAHTVGAAWLGAMVAEQMGSRAVGIFAAVFTFLVLMLTEIIPKSLGVRFAQRLGPHIAWPLQVMIWSTWPIAKPAKAAMRLLMAKGPARGPTEDEVVVFSSLAAMYGEVRRDEHEWVRNALRLDRFTAGDLRTPRTVVETLPADLIVSEVIAHPERWVHSRVPLIENGDLDQVIGLVYRREVFDAALARPAEPLRLRDLKHPIQFAPESMPAHRLLDLFIKERKHMVAVVDEYGGFEGVVTLEDVLECLLGAEIVDEHDEFEDMQEIARHRNPHEERAAEPDAAGD